MPVSLPRVSPDRRLLHLMIPLINSAISALTMRYSSQGLIRLIAHPLKVKHYTSHSTKSSQNVFKNCWYFIKYLIVHQSTGHGQKQYCQPIVQRARTAPSTIRKALRTTSRPRHRKPVVPPQNWARARCAELIKTDHCARALLLHEKIKNNNLALTIASNAQCVHTPIQLMYSTPSNIFETQFTLCLKSITRWKHHVRERETVFHN